MVFEWRNFFAVVAVQNDRDDGDSCAHMKNSKKTKKMKFPCLEVTFKKAFPEQKGVIHQGGSEKIMIDKTKASDSS